MPVSPACPANLPCHSDTDVCLTHSLGALSEDVIAVATLALSGARDLASHRRPSQISSISFQATPMPPPPSFRLMRQCEMVWPIMVLGLEERNLPGCFRS